MKSSYRLVQTGGEIMVAMVDLDENGKFIGLSSESALPAELVHVDRAALLADFDKMRAAFDHQTITL